MAGLPTEWNSHTDGNAYAMVLSGDRLYVGGDFQHVAGQPRGLLAAVELDTGQPTSWNPELYNLLKTEEPDSSFESVWSMVVTNNTVYVSGYSAVDNPYKPMHFVAAVDAISGRVLWKTEADDNVEAMVFHGDELYWEAPFFTLVAHLVIFRMISEASFFKEANREMGWPLWMQRQVRLQHGCQAL